MKRAGPATLGVAARQLGRAGRERRPCRHRRSSGLVFGRLSFQSRLCSRRAGGPHKMRDPQGPAFWESTLCRSPFTLRARMTLSQQASQRGHTRPTRLRAQRTSCPCPPPPARSVPVKTSPALLFPTVWPDRPFHPLNCPFHHRTPSVSCQTKGRARLPLPAPPPPSPSGSDQSRSHMGPSWGTSCFRSIVRIWSRVWIDGERPPCTQKIYGATRQERGQAEPSASPTRPTPAGPGGRPTLPSMMADRLR